MSLGRGIKLSTGFDLNAQVPLDSRQVFDTISERNSLPSINLYEGLHCYVKETKQNYQYINGAWENFATNIDSSSISLPEIEYGDTEPTDDNIILWVDTSADEGARGLLSDELILEFTNAIQLLNNEISKLKADNIELEKRIAYLEMHSSSGGGETPSVDGVSLTFEDGSIMTFEDGSIMIFED